MYDKMNRWGRSQYRDDKRSGSLQIHLGPHPDLPSPLQLCKPGEAVSLWTSSPREGACHDV
jgi:hypothetical protein